MCKKKTQTTLLFGRTFLKSVVVKVIPSTYNLRNCAPCGRIKSPSLLNCKEELVNLISQMTLLESSSALTVFLIFLICTIAADTWLVALCSIFK